MPLQSRLPSQVYRRSNNWALLAVFIEGVGLIMPTDLPNPFESTWTSDEPQEYLSGSSEYPEVFAGRFARLVANIIDGLVLILPVIIVSRISFEYLSLAGLGFSNFELSQDEGLSFLASILVASFPWVIFFALNGYFLHYRGQSIGKMAMGVQIVDFRTNRLIGLGPRMLARFLWLLPLTLIAERLTPTDIDERLLNLVQFIGILIIFGPSQRCLHDYIAGTQVLRYRPSRPGLNDL
jgi:uncharacterized RDD family membrane protein YckC